MKKIIVLFFAFVMFFTSKTSKVEAIDEFTSLSINSPSAILIEYSSGKILYSKGADKKMYPASMTKMMSMYLLLDCIKNKSNTFDEIVTVSTFASSMGGSQIFLKENEKMSFEDLFTAVAVASANDAVVALAEHTYGDLDTFINKMNEKAKEFNMSNTNFVNTTGFHDPNHYTTSYDMAILARKLLIDHKDNLLKYTSIYETYLREDTDNPFWLVTTNKLLNTYEGMDGLKTGYTSQAGYNLTATASKNNMRLISVVMGGSTSKSRNADITTILNYGFNNYKSVVLYQKESVIKEIDLENSKDKKYSITSKEDISVVIGKSENINELVISVQINNMNIPISKDEIIGKIEIKDKKGNILGKYDLYSQKDIVALSFLDTFINFLKLLF